MAEPWTEGTRPWWEKGYAAWDWVTATRVVSAVPCELVYAAGSFSAAAAATIYDGQSTSGDVIIVLQCAVIAWITPLALPEPILCRRGIYVVIPDNCNGVFVMWRPLPAGWRP